MLKEIVEIKEVTVGGFLVHVWEALDGFMWKAISEDEVVETFGPFGEFETAVASAWQWLKDGNMA